MSTGNAALRAEPSASQESPSLSQSRSWVISVADGDPAPPLLHLTIAPSRLLVLEHPWAASLEADPVSDAIPLPFAAGDPHTQTSISLSGGGSAAIDLTVGRSAPSPGTADVLRTMLRITNTSSAPITYTQSGAACRWEILSQAGDVLFDSLRGRMIPHFMILRRLAPGKSQMIEDTVPLRNDDGTPLPSGHYILRADLSIGTSAKLQVPISLQPHAR